jgi:hypothetical protein
MQRFVTNVSFVSFLFLLDAYAVARHRIPAILPPIKISALLKPSRIAARSCRGVFQQNRSKPVARRCLFSGGQLKRAGI